MGRPRMLVGSVEDVQTLKRASRERSKPEWIVPKDAEPGDKVFVFVRGLGIVATGEIATRPLLSNASALGKYTARLGNVVLLPLAIAEETIRDAIPGWNWLSYPRSYATPPEDVADLLFGLVTQRHLPNSWIVKGKPSENDLQESIRKDKTANWRTRRPPRGWRVGDNIFVWEAAPSLRIVGLATLRRIATELDAYGDIRFGLRYGTDYMRDGPTADELRRVPSLAATSFLKAGPSGTVFPLTGQQANDLLLAVRATHGWFADDMAGFSYAEGSTRTVTVNRYERDRRARDACIARHGVECHACGIDFERRYGALGKGFIHVHHLRPLSLLGGESDVDPIRDLRPVCPNCHAMLHRGRIEPLSIEELATVLAKAQARGRRDPIGAARHARRS